MLRIQLSLDSLLDIGIGHVRACGNGDVLLLAGTQILSGYIYDTVGIDIEGNLDLRDSSGELEQYRPDGTVRGTYYPLAN